MAECDAHAQFDANGYTDRHRHVGGHGHCYGDDGIRRAHLPADQLVGVPIGRSYANADAGTGWSTHGYASGDLGVHEPPSRGRLAVTTRLIDLTRRITSALPVWPGDLPFLLTPVATHAAGDGYALSHFAATLHLGTHIDAPRHFIPDGATVDMVPLATLVGPAFIVDVPEAVRAIDAPYLERLTAAGALPPDTIRILFRTRNSAHLIDGRDDGPFRRDFVAVTAGGARYLVSLGVRLVGIDGPSIAPWDDTDTPHTVLLGAGVIVVEGLALADAPPGHGVLVCLPLRIEGAEGAPARAVWIAGADPAGDVEPPG